jgi:hypothetical protein
MTRWRLVRERIGAAPYYYRKPGVPGVIIPECGIWKYLPDYPPSACGDFYRSLRVAKRKAEETHL